MDTPKEIRKGEVLDWKKLEGYLKGQLPQIKGDMSVAQFHGGHANLTYLLTFDKKELILRRPPFGKIAPGAHDMKREYKVLSKLYKYFSLAPQAFHLCLDKKIIGSKFVIIERKRGVIVRTKMLDCFKGFKKPEKRITNAIIKAQAKLHLVDYKEADLNNLGRPLGFVERQLDGWSKRFSISKTNDSKVMDNILKWLKADIPNSQKESIIHNDIKPDNCQFQSDNPDKVTAIFDWDMCTLGDPLIDFATTLSFFPDERKKKFKNLPVSLTGDYPPREYLIEKYQEYTGFNLDQIIWYEVFSYWKGAIIFQQLYKRYVDGMTQDKRMGRMNNAAKAMTEVAHQIIKTS